MLPPGGVPLEGVAGGRAAGDGPVGGVKGLPGKEPVVRPPSGGTCPGIDGGIQDWMLTDISNSVKLGGGIIRAAAGRAPAMLCQ